MRRNILLALLVCFSVFASHKGVAQLVCPPNIDWEMGDTTNWIGEYGGDGAPGGVSPTSPPVPPPPGIWMSAVTTPVMSFATGRIEIMNTSMPVDPHGGFPVVAPTGGLYSIRLGENGKINRGAERVQYTFTVPTNIDNYSINFLYAIVLQDPGSGHDNAQRPRFTVSVRDAATGLPIKDGCYDLNFIVQPDIPGFIVSSIDPNVRVKPWTRHTLNLSGAAGRSVIVDVLVADCSLGGHWGYGYFDVEECVPFGVSFTATTDSCNLNRGGAHLKGPNGFWKYEWYNNDYSVLVDTGQYANFVPITKTPQIYHVVLTPHPSVNLCPDTLHTVHLADISIDKIDSTCMTPGTPVLLEANINGGSGALTYEWTERYPLNTLSCTGCPTPTATPSSTNYYTVKVTDTSGCYKTETIIMHVNENTIEALEDFVVCRPGYTQLDVNSYGIPPLSRVDCGLDTSAACTTPDIIVMGTVYRPATGTREDTSTLNNPFAAQYTSAHMQFIVKKEDLYASNMRNGRLTSLGFEIKYPGTASFNKFTISLACTDQNTLGGAFVPNVVKVYEATDPVTPVAGWNDFIFNETYNWDRNKNLVVDICFSGPSTNVPAAAVILNTGTQDALVAYTRSVNGNVCLNGKSDDQLIHNGRPNMRAGFCKSPDTLFQYTWSPSIYLQDSTIKSPIAYVNKSITYYVETVGGSDCLIKDTVNITVPTPDYQVYPRDTSICYGHSFKMFAAGTASVQWYDYDSIAQTFTIPTDLRCDDCEDATKSPTPIAKPEKSKVYAVEYTDQYNCKDTFLVDVTVRPLPEVRILNRDTTIKYGQSMQLLVSGAYLYSWSPLSSITNPNLANPHVAPTEPTTFYVWGLAEDGCRNIDSIKINIDYRDNLFVPSAFTPNGDGKNDVFRISNLTFQKLQEFRIFNRWGQEIFSTTDPKKGWDGSWKGVPQDMGVYQYLIKVAYPDGYIETYQGDVTIVR